MVLTVGGSWTTPIPNRQDRTAREAANDWTWMLSRTDIERLAAMAHALRNDWPIPSLCTWLMKDHASRAYRDVAVALAYVASDPATKTPKRMNELGPWWSASVSGPASQPIHFARCPEPGHTSYPAHNCGACRTEALESTIEPEVVDRGDVYEKGAALVRAALGRKS